MKIIVVILISCLLFVSCQKKDSLNEENQVEEKQKLLSQEPIVHEKKSDNSYVFDIDLFKYLDEFPRKIAGIKEMYSNEPFEEQIFDNDLKGFLGLYWYTLSSPNIRFSFLGDTIEDAKLRIVVITNSNFQCETMQVIGMPVEELERVSGKKLTLDKTIRVSTALFILVIETKEDIVSSYRILAEL